MRTCERCGAETEWIRSVFELRPDGIPQSRYVCQPCFRDWDRRYSGMVQDRQQPIGEVRGLPLFQEEPA